MKLEQKHAACYYPYDVDIMVYHRTQPAYKFKLTLPYLADLTGVKLILRPMSDLANITSPFYLDSNMDIHDQVKLNELIDEILYDKQSHKTIYDIPYKYMEVMFENHFDVFDLIKEGLAVDMNDIK